ncbi:MAG: class I SAM-dependent methyltransferase [bacterium]
MKRSPLTHERIFRDQAFAENYVRRHRKMVERFGYEYAGKLSSRGFKNGRIIDVGCGCGGTDMVIAHDFPDCEIVGIDLSEPLVCLANQAAQAANLEKRMIFLMGDVHRIPFDDASFQVVLNINMVHLVEHPIQMLNEMERVLAPDGLLFIADLRRSWLGFMENEIKSSLTVHEAEDLIGCSQLRNGAFYSSLLWWRFEA